MGVLEGVGQGGTVVGPMGYAAPFGMRGGGSQGETAPSTTLLLPLPLTPPPLTPPPCPDPAREEPCGPDPALGLVKLDASSIGD